MTGALIGPPSVERWYQPAELEDPLPAARRAVHRLRDRGQIQMIVAAGGYRGADENRIDEQRGSDLLQPQPGMAEGPRDDVSRHRQRETEAQHATEDHQDQFEPVERSPFQVTLPLQHQFVGDGHRQALRRRPGISASWPGKSAKRVFALDVPAIHVFGATGRKTWMPGTRPGMTMQLSSPRQLIARISVLILSACGPS